MSLNEMANMIASFYSDNQLTNISMNELGLTKMYGHKRNSNNNSFTKKANISDKEKRLN